MKEFMKETLPLFCHCGVLLAELPGRKPAEYDEVNARGMNDGVTAVEIIYQPKTRARWRWLRTPKCLNDVDMVAVRAIVHSLWPMIALTLCQALLSTVCLMFCGHLSTTELAGVALALTVLSITGFSLAEGLTSASQTLFSQTFGTGQLSRMDMYLVKSLLLLPFFLLPCVAIHMNMEYILTMAGQRPEVARIAGRFLSICIPALLISQCHYIFMDYMTCQNIRLMATISSFCGFAAATVFNYILVYVVEMRSDGSATAMAIAAVIMLTIDVTYVATTKRKSWAGWSREVFSDWLPMIGIALAGILMMCLEWWALEIAIVVTSFEGELELASLSVVLNLHIITTIIPISFSMGTSILVGQHLGSGEVDKMKAILKLAYGIIALIQLVFSSVLFGARNHVPLLFTTDPCVISKVSDILSVHVITIFLNGLMNVSIGVMRGCGLQGVASLVILVGLYFIGLPIGALLMFFTNWGVKGMVSGIAVGVAFEVVVVITIIIRTDWQKQSIKAKRRVKAEMDLIESRQEEEKKFIRAPLATPEPSPAPSNENVNNYRSLRRVLVKRFLFLGALASVAVLGLFLHLFVLVPPVEICSRDLVFNTTTNYGIRYCPHLVGNSSDSTTPLTDIAFTDKYVCV